MNTERAGTLAKQSGFAVVGPLDVGALSFRQDVRDMCTPELCPEGYGQSWSCPPAVPALEELSVRARAFTEGILVQTIGELEDPFDFETVMETSALHAEHFMELTDRLGAETERPLLALGAGACKRCASCTYPDAPCALPDKQIVSMEASGLLVNQVCEDSGISYNNGENTITFTSCCLF
ncbi:MAG: DUF2284 domain-containing protein [Coriobacteriales bacterium]|jgi:predicted metal-binding protein|nr:DUF2284 domain-containing protein [Coriobacteriales bacterium]